MLLTEWFMFNKSLFYLMLTKREEGRKKIKGIEKVLHLQ